MYDHDDFRDSIDDMCDNAVRRMFAFREGGIDRLMQPGDQYYSEIEKRDERLDIIEFDTITRAQIIDSIHSDAVAGEIADYFKDILAGAAIVLARHASYLGVGSDIIVPTIETARTWVDERLLLGKSSLENEHRLQLVRYELGAIGATSLMLEADDNNWQLHYEAHRRGSLIHY